MLLKKTAWFWKNGFIAVSFILMLNVSGCSDTTPEETQAGETIIKDQERTDHSQENAEEITEIFADIYADFYKQTAEVNKTADLEMIRNIINRLGENGYPAVDSRNQINMSESEQVVEFCKKVDARKEAEITILEVGYSGEFVKYHLHTKDGNVDVLRS